MSVSKLKGHLARWAMRAADAVRHWKIVQAVDCKPGHLEMRPKQMAKKAKPA